MERAAPEPRRWPPPLAACALAVLAALLAWRQIESHDIGYHLAYGERFARELRPVDDDTFIYPTLDLASPARPDPGPGCWYDDGRYRFPNANWLSQAITWGAFAVGGDVGLTGMVALLLAAIVLVQFTGMRRCGLSSPIAAAASLLLLLVLSWRVEPRPELFGYLVLSAQAVMLLATVGRGRELTARTTVALVLLQVLLVNLHSYFVLGVAVSAGFWVQTLLVPPAPGQRRRLGILVGAQALACLANPWTWRLAILPLQTVLYLRANGIGDPAHQPRHPWSAIDEFRPLPLPWHDGPTDLPLLLFHALLAAAALAFVAALRWRRFAHAAVLLVATLTALSMRRNVPPAALLLVPTIATALAPLGASLQRRRPMAIARLERVAVWVVPAITLLLALLVATGAFYRWTGSRAQFGSGFSPLYLPVGVARWLDEQQPNGRLWTDFNASSNLHFLTAARPEVPLLTNTWAYPPAVMHLVLDRLAGAPFAEARAWGIEVVALETDSTAAPMVRQLANDRAFTLVHVEPRYVVFVRTHGSNQTLARDHAAQQQDFDLAAFRQPWSRWPELRRRALRAMVRTCQNVGWDDVRITCAEALLAEQPEDAALWAEVGATRAQRGIARLRAGDAAAGHADLLQAQEALARSLAQRPGTASVQQNLDVVRRALASSAGR